MPESVEVAQRGPVAAHLVRDATAWVAELERTQRRSRQRRNGGFPVPALPWVRPQVIDPDREYIVMASRLPLKAHRFIPGFLARHAAHPPAARTHRGARRVRAQRPAGPQDLLDLLGLDGPGEPGRLRGCRAPSSDHPTTSGPHGRVELRLPAPARCGDTVGLERHARPGPMTAVRGIRARSLALSALVDALHAALDGGDELWS